ncbi:MAG TPA: TonB-dependent receptor, partial [Thermoanaerobaculia bacterium]|nr:TonB-dependent receptor [Thermoanaerobaculia bacterium]
MTGGLTAAAAADEPESFEAAPPPRGTAAPASAAAGAAAGAAIESPAEAGERVADGVTPAPVSRAAFFERLTVLGSAENLIETPGSAHYITKSDLERQSNTDLHRILRQVPGINIQEEDGYGLRPNIGMRGTGVERSSKITLLEDGVLIAPAPYAAPAAYYVPTAGRMSGFEILKGASSVRQGPFTTGGVINMLSADYPLDWGGHIEAAYGTESTGKLRALLGDTGQRFSWLLETFQFTTDGFKDLDGGGDAGTELSDYLGKLRFNSRPDAAVFQALDIKLGRTDQLGHETYLGLTEEDFRADPFRRYASSAADSIDTEHEQVQLRYFVQPSERLDVTATVYRNDFFRNWHKLDRVAGVAISDLLADPGRFSDAIAIARGEIDSAPGALTLRNNRRDYYSQGVETVLGLHLGGRTRHELELGVRFHEDEEDRFQEDDRWQMTGGRLALTALGAPGSESNRISSAEALAFFVQDRISFGRWVLRPGVRFETIDFRRENFGRSDPDRSGADLAVAENGVDAWVPGLGVDYLVGDRTSV